MQKLVSLDVTPKRSRRIRTPHFTLVGTPIDTNTVETGETCSKQQPALKSTKIKGRHYHQH